MEPWHSLAVAAPESLELFRTRLDRAWSTLGTVEGGTGWIWDPFALKFYDSMRYRLFVCLFVFFREQITPKNLFGRLYCCCGWGRENTWMGVWILSTKANYWGICVEAALWFHFHWSISVGSGSALGFKPSWARLEFQTFGAVSVLKTVG